MARASPMNKLETEILVSQIDAAFVPLPPGISDAHNTHMPTVAITVRQGVGPMAAP
jgi:hypothetical protein